MHFHLPKPLHGWREFAGEVGIIVVGVLIALIAEQLVESWHWRDQVREAEEAMRLELQTDNGPQALARASIEPCLAQQIDAIQTEIEAGADRARVRELALAYSPPRRTWDEQAWRSASASQAAGHMPAEAMIRWSGPYNLVPSLAESNANEQGALSRLRAGERTPGAASPAQKDRWLLALQDLRHENDSMAYGSYALLAKMNGAGAPVSARGAQQVLQEMRSRYGLCAIIPAIQGFDDQYQQNPQGRR
jgi:hypothetical protein